MEIKKGLTKNLKRFFGIGDMTFTIMTQVENVFFNFFLTNIAMFDLGITTIIQTFTTVIDAAFAWIYGAIMNGTKPLKWGRYRSWLLITPWFVPLFYMLKYMVIGDKVTSIVIIIAAGVISSVIWNFGYVANMAVIPLVGKTPQDRAQLSATRATYNRAGSLLFSYLGLPLATFFAGIVTNQYKFAALALILSILAAIGYNIHYKLTEGYEEIPSRNSDKKEIIEPTQSIKKEKTSAKAMIKGLFANSHLLCLILAEFTRWCTNFVLSGCAMYYFVYIAKNAGLIANYLLIVNISCMIGAYTSKYLASKFGTKPAFVFGFLLLGCALLSARAFYQSPWAVIGFMAIGQYGYGCIYSLSPSLFADAAIFAEYKTGEDSTGWIMGLNNVPLKVALVVRSFIINGVLAAVGFSAAISPASVSVTIQAGIANAFMVIPGIALVIGGLLVLFGFRISKDQVNKMSAEIEARK